MADSLKMQPSLVRMQHTKVISLHDACTYQTRVCINSCVRIDGVLFQIVECLAETNLGRCYLAVPLDRGRYISSKPVVIKISDLNAADKMSWAEDPLQEANIMQVLCRRDPTPKHLIGIYGFHRPPVGQRSAGYCALVLEYANGGELLDHIDPNYGLVGPFANARRASKDPLRFEASIAAVFAQIVKGVQQMHSRGYAHLDLSLENILVCTPPSGVLGKRKSRSGSDPSRSSVGRASILKLCDLGMAKEFDEKNPVVAFSGGKRSYKAPEIHLRGRCNAPLADVYSLGIILFILLTGCPPYNSTRDNAHYMTLRDPHFKLASRGGVKGIKILLRVCGRPNLSSVVAQLIAGMLAPENKRMSLDEVASHGFFRRRPVVPSTSVRGGQGAGVVHRARVQRAASL